VISKVLSAGPTAIAVAKRLPDVALAPMAQAREQTAEIIAELRTGAEAQEGMAAFLEKRAPRWAPGTS
jgi:methylglutaconyl-CoA hydratase